MRSTSTSSFPPTTGIRWFNVFILTATPAVAIYGLLTKPCRRDTLLFSAAYYVFTMLGITAGYHRLWSHRSYKGSQPLQVFLLSGGASAVQGSCYWWARAHRSHHRYTDTDLDPYNAKRGLLWTHLGWMVFRSAVRSGAADITDLRRDALVQFQHRHYFLWAAVFGYILPAVVPGALWGDWAGGVCFSAALRLTIAHHSTFCINSLAHHLGSAPYDDARTPRDHLLSALLTMGEGYHNFHHQFPMDYRNAFYWYQYDPTKWFIAVCAWVGCAGNLRVFPGNEIRKGVLAMKLKELKREQDGLVWPKSIEELPVVDWEQFREESKRKQLMLVSGFIHDVSSFLDEHPGGRLHLTSYIGKDASAAFFGGVYNHSNAAHNLLSTLRVGILSGGLEVVPEHAIPPAQRMLITETKAPIYPQPRSSP
ncbi:hypothetical protein D9611_009195 [Ephemerocybe angulata]|uniref:Acyl-CoA desaturase n=1 Tax=Ephemerocybe angulata TaxID=980116 RepID=A0A8H5CEU6_9AGAR|nr:hypothetical protein D9611_009195 [Tulosesus angulatus]